MKYPRINFTGAYHLDLDVPENYKEIVKNIDENFIRGTENLAKIVLKEFEAEDIPTSFQWDKERGLCGINIGQCGIFLYENKKYIFKNIDESWQALAVFNVISLYLNKLMDYKK